MFDVEYYETANGKCPTAEFFDDLNKETELPNVMRLLDMLKEEGYLLPRPHAAYLRNGIYELRIRTIHRHIRLLYFFYHQEAIMVSHGLIKKTNKVPDYEIDKAISNKKDFEVRQKRLK